MSERTSLSTLPQLSPRGRWWLRPGVRAAVFQTLLAAILVLAVTVIATNVNTNLARVRLEPGFAFLAEPASFELGENAIGYRAGQSYLKALLAGLVNTIKVAVLGIILATMLGTAIALARLSDNLMLSRLAWAYVEVMRNIPLLLQILFWHTFIVRQLPIPRSAWSPVPGVFLSNRGLIVPTVDLGDGSGLAILTGVIGLALALACVVRALRLRATTGRAATATWVVAAIAAAAPFAFWLLTGPSIAIEVPVLRGFNFVGGATLTPEFVALLLALVTYQAGFSAETIRSGILGVAKGQTDAARGLGLNRGQIMRLVTLPQALRIVVPPLTSQYLSLTKNSSLAVAIGYPDLVRVGTVVLGDTGRSLECISIILIVYLTLSLLTATLMNHYNSRAALRGWRT